MISLAYRDVAYYTKVFNSETLRLLVLLQTYNIVQGAVSKLHSDYNTDMLLYLC